MIRQLGLVLLLASLTLGLRLNQRPLHHDEIFGETQSCSRTSSGNTDVCWCTQPLNHFEAADRRTWKQRYQVNSAFYEDGGPVFLLLGGEGEATVAWLEKDTHVMLMAKKFKALVFQLEHRFYGQSRPTPDLSTANLVYLSSEQALADAALFRNVMTKRRNLPEHTKWVVFGGSYSGSLAAWFKLKYPHLAIGAVASSAPLLAVIDFADYYRLVGHSLGPECSAKVKEAFQLLQVQTARRALWHEIDTKFKTCTPFDGYSSLNVQKFFEIVSSNFAEIVQYNKDNRLAGRINITIDDICSVMQSSKTAIDGLAAVSNMLLKKANATCLSYDYGKAVREMRDVSFDAEPEDGDRKWMYQTCTEFGFFQSSGAKDQPFGDLLPVSYYIQQCRDIFEDFFDEALLQNGIFRTNTEYGGMGPRLTNVTFVHGSVDPWHALGILKDISSDVTAHFIKGASHCADMYPPTNDDDEALRVGREKIEQDVAKWLQ